MVYILLNARNVNEIEGSVPIMFGSWLQEKGSVSCNQQHAQRLQSCATAQIEKERSAKRKATTSMTNLDPSVNDLKG